MPEEENKPKHGLMDKILHHGHHQHEAKADTKPAGGEPKKETEAEKFKDYIKKDEQMEEEGKEYGRLM